MVAFLDPENHIGGLPGLASRIFLRFFQLVMALTVCGLYGTDIHDKTKPVHYARSSWVYAIVVGAMSAITVIVYAVPLLQSYWGFAWDAVLFILWTAVFGVFGKMFIGAHSGHNIQRERSAVWIDLINMLLWLVTAVYSAVLFFMFRRARTLHTGRAAVWGFGGGGRVRG